VDVALEGGEARRGIQAHDEREERAVLDDLQRQERAPQEHPEETDEEADVHRGDPERVTQRVSSAPSSRACVPLESI